MKFYAKTIKGGERMENKIIYILAVVVILIGAVILVNVNPSITSATVAGQKKCVGAEAALKFINEKGCVRVYDDLNCEEKGLVEVQC